jgi:hypothetical protein
MGNKVRMQMIRKITFGLVLLVSSLTTLKTSNAQSLFGTRGPAAQFGQGFQSQTPSNSLSSLPVAGTWGGSLLGSGDSQSGRGFDSTSMGNRVTSSAGQRPAINLRSAITERSTASSSETIINPPGQTASSRGRGVLETRQRITFRFEPLDTETIVSHLAEQFTAMALQRPDLARIVPQMTDSGELLLSGEVDSEDSRQLAEILARFEPGVRTVVNRLTIRKAVE